MQTNAQVFTAQPLIAFELIRMPSFRGGISLSGHCGANATVHEHQVSVVLSYQARGTHLASVKWQSERTMHFHSAGRGSKAGIADMQALAASAITALQHANLVDEAQYVHAHVLARAPEELLERTVVGEQTVWTFKPMVELLLHELRYIATAPDMSLAVRREQARWTIEVAGF